VPGIGRRELSGWLWRLWQTKTEATPQQEQLMGKGDPEAPLDSPGLDLSNESVKALIRTARERERHL
jgi:hypothetical protein